MKTKQVDQEKFAGLSRICSLIVRQEFLKELVNCVTYLLVMLMLTSHSITHFITNHKQPTRKGSQTTISNNKIPLSFQINVRIRMEWSDGLCLRPTGLNPMTRPTQLTCSFLQRQKRSSTKHHWKSKRRQTAKYGKWTDCKFTLCKKISSTRSRLRLCFFRLHFHGFISILWPFWPFPMSAKVRPSLKNTVSVNLKTGCKRFTRICFFLRW